MKLHRHGYYFSPYKMTKSDEDNDKAKKEKKKDELVTKEMFLRDMLSSETQNEDDYNINDKKKGENESQSPKSGTVKRKKKNGSRYRVVDNRDNLPFLVEVTTPDPYTNNDVMIKNARQNTSNSKKAKKNGIKMRHNLIGMDGVDSIKSSIYKRQKDGKLHQVLGEFAMDKSTNCGDIIDVGDGTQYQVQKARCQYKYAGGKRFVMTRKILEVKEVKRILIEKEVKQLFHNDGNQPQNNNNDTPYLE